MGICPTLHGRPSATNAFLQVLENHMDERTERSAPPQRRRGAPAWILLAAVIAVIGALLYFHDDYRASKARTAVPGPATVPGK